MAKKIKSKLPSPKRVNLLNRGARLTGTDRNSTYGEPALNMKVQGELQRVINKYLVHKNVPGYEAALNSVAVKLARAVCGPVPGDDTFVDGAAYFGIAGEILYPES